MERAALNHIRVVLRTLAENRGVAALWGAMAALVLVLAAAAVLDVYQLSIARNWAYQVASDAALRGVSRGRNFASLSENGRMSLDETAAVEEATTAVAQAMESKGVVAYVLDVRALPDGGGVPGFPPVPRASQQGNVDWSSTAPAVGVYLEIPVPVTFFGWVNGARTITVHAFAAAALAEAR